VNEKVLYNAVNSTAFKIDCFRALLGRNPRGIDKSVVWRMRLGFSAANACVQEYSDGESATESNELCQTEIRIPTKMIRS
jgi:hypothetical protein